MAQAEDHTERETTATSEGIADEVTTDATETDDVTKYESVDYVNDDESRVAHLGDAAASGGAKRLDETGKTTRRRRRKKRSRRERCGDSRRWACEGEPLWRIYMKSYLESRERSEDVLPVRETPTFADVPTWPRRPAEGAAVEEPPHPHECFPLGGFQIERRDGTTLPAALDGRCKRTRIWRSMRTRRSMPLSTNVSRRGGKMSKIEMEEWRGAWPCTTRDLTSELRARRKEGRKKRRDAFPCDPRDDDADDDPLLRERRSDFACRKELGHVRAPVTCSETRLKLSVDRAVGERPGLVDGDYVITELTREGDGRRVYANVVLRGLKGMHLPELSALRERRDTWKFCFYQAVVALLAKTQLRYKYAWSANIDYVYDHAWTLYAHIGTINVKSKQRFDDVVVYNYKYSIEIELIREMRDVPVVREVDFDYEEGGLKRRIALRRKDPLRVRVELGCRKITDPVYASAHRDVREIEEWFDRTLTARHRNCIFRTTRFSLAFWQDGLFWYLYNPYRCDEFGHWSDDGRACIVKFCTRDTLRRHLMILLLRAYAYEASPDERTSVGSDVLDVQIFDVTFRCCQLHNLKLLQRARPRLPRRDVVDERPSDSLDIVDGLEKEEEEVEEENRDDHRDPREKPAWLRRFRVTWGRCATTSRKRPTAKIGGGAAKAKWHQYHVEESNRLFSLWGEIHITDAMFDRSNRGMQTYACYAVCAGMTRITAPEYWSPKILDAIVVCGDRYYARSRREAERKSAEREYAHVSRWTRYLSSRFRIGDIAFEVRMLPAVCGELYARSADCLWRTLERTFLEHHFGVLTCESACLGLFKFCGAYYMCDVNSFGPPVFKYGHGAAYLMRATSFYRFMTVLVLTIGTPERNRFSVNPVEILKVVEVGAASDSRARTDERKNCFARKARTFDERRRQKAERQKRRRAITRAIGRPSCSTNDN